MIQLPNGDWVKPESVTDIYVLAGDVSYKVYVNSNLEHIIDGYGTDMQAGNARDVIAEEINEALYPNPCANLGITDADMGS